MDSKYEKLRQFNEVWEGRQLFTACIEFMVWYELAENVENGQGLPEVEKSYWAMVEAIRPRITYYAAGVDGTRRKLKKDSLDLFPHTLRLTKPNDIAGRNMVTFLQGGEDDKPDVFLQGYLWECCFQRLGLGIEEVVNDPEAFVRRCIQIVSGIKFKSGIGGFSMNYEDVYINGNEHLCDPIVGRFPGVNVINPWRYRDLDGVPTVNWLTLVSTADIDRLGGWDALTSQVKPPIVMHRLPHGAMLQAGPKPLLGDVNEQERLDAYHEVGRLLAPVKSTIEVQSKLGGSRLEATHWMHRFFRPQPSTS